MEDLFLDSTNKKKDTGETLTRFERDWFPVNFMFYREFLMKSVRIHIQEYDNKK